jgi:uncharacterized protein (DUF2252 family)
MLAVHYRGRDAQPQSSPVFLMAVRSGRFNTGREPERHAMKFSAMQQNSFVFMRGSCHLFYRDWPVSAKAPTDFITRH